MKTIKPIAYSYPLVRSERIVIVGGGNVTKSILLVSSLLHPALKYRIIVRSSRSAELLRAFVNDLPRIDVLIEALPFVPDLSSELVLLTLGKKTDIFSRRAKKESLFAVNRKIIENITPQLRTSTVIVVTNPTTAITKYLVEQGIQAYGVGVANDQFRFTNQGEAKYYSHYFAGAHNFAELALGTSRTENRANFIFSHEEYKEILRKQDKRKLTLASLLRGKLDFDWENLEAVNRAFPSEFRWYARQRIHSKFHGTAISGALAILNTLSFFLDNQANNRIVSLEMPLFIPEINKDIVMGWPIDDDSREPIELTFDAANQSKVSALFAKYEVRGQDAETALYFKSPFGECISISGDRKLIHDFYRRRMAYLYSIYRTVEANHDVYARIRIPGDNNELFEKIGELTAGAEPEIVPQHRGKNQDEHTDLRIYREGSARYVLFPDGETCAKIDDAEKTVEMGYKSEKGLYHELRRIVRDEISIPCFTVNNARILHAGLVICKDVALVILGAQGGGKSTAALATLCDDTHSKYGSSERVAIWFEAGAMYCLGIPESNTVFAGVLRQLPAFAKFSRRIPDSDLWDRSRKVRLQADDILQSTGCSPIRREVRADIIVEVNYDGNSEFSTTHKIEPSAVKGMLQNNDLTEIDEVRLPWLNWFPYSPNNKIFDNPVNDIPAYRVNWTSIDGLREELLNIVARFKLK